MNSRFTWFFILVFALSLSGLIYWVLIKSDHVTNLENAYAYRPDPQATDQRQWINIEFKYPATNSDIMSSYWISSVGNGIFYIADDNSRSGSTVKINAAVPRFRLVMGWL